MSTSPAESQTTLTEGTQGLRVPDVATPHGGQVGRPQVRRGPVVARQGVRAQSVQRVPPGVTHNGGHRGVRAGVHQTPVVVRPVGGRVQGQAYMHTRESTFCGSFGACVCVWFWYANSWI